MATRRGLCVSAFMALVSLPHAALAEYLLAPGDVIEFTVAGAAEVKQRSQIDSSGRINLPLLGELGAAGRPLSELRAEVRRKLPGKTLRRKTTSGTDTVAIDPDEVTLEIVEYRPVYIDGDVAKPGEQPFRLGMTIRQAIALAGGYDHLHFRAGNPIMLSADLRTEYQSLWTEFAQAQAQVWRAQAELTNKSTLPSTDDLSELPIGPSLVAQIVRFESEKLATNRAAYVREKDSLTRQIKQSDEQAELVKEQLENIKQGVILATAELARVQALYEKGVTPVTRVMEERRFTLQTHTQRLQATERFGQVRKDREELVRQLQSFEAERQAQLSRDLHDAEIRLASAKTRLQAVDEKLTYAGLLKSQLTRGRGAAPELVLHRKSERGLERISATEDTEILPGDTIEVTLRSRAGLLAAEP